MLEALATIAVLVGVVLLYMCFLSAAGSIPMIRREFDLVWILCAATSPLIWILPERARKAWERLSRGQQG